MLDKKKPTDQNTFVRTMAGLTRRKTHYIALVVRRNLIQCFLKRPPERSVGEAQAEYWGYIHEMASPRKLIDFMSDLTRNGVHLDRCPAFLVWLLTEYMRQRHAFASININSIGHTAAALGSFGEKAQQKDGPVMPVSKLILRERRGVR
jgi:hypothetical protein